MTDVENNATIQEQVDSLKLTYKHHLPIDTAVRQVLPEGFENVRGEQYGSSGWSFTAKVIATYDGIEKNFFLKYVPGDHGRQLLYGEFTGMTELWKISPEFVVKPLAWGKLHDTEQECYFLLMEFKDFIPILADVNKLGVSVARMHKKSQLTADTGGKFGFPVQTFDGTRLHSVAWDSSWASFFSKLLATAYQHDADSNGVWPELEALFKRVQDELIPRLIGTLEKDGKTVKPTLLHGDMWEGNVGTDALTGDPWIFDCAAYYGHHEMELGIWRAARHEFSHNGIYVASYLREFDDDDCPDFDYYPDDEFDDRVRLYSAKTNFMYSACFPRAQSRIDIVNDFTYLLNKYCGDTVSRRRAMANTDEVADASKLDTIHVATVEVSD